MKKKYYIFDYDDTLMQTRECKTNALIELGKRRYNREIDPAEVTKNWGISHESLFERLFFISGDEVHSAMTEYAKMDDEFPLIPHIEAREALEVLDDLYSLIIVSSCQRQLIIDQLEKSNISHIKFAAIYGCDETKFHKPSGKVFDEVFSDFPDTSLEKVVYIGDGIKDYQASKERGVEFFGVNRSQSETLAIRQAGGTVVESLLDLTDM